MSERWVLKEIYIDRLKEITLFCLPRRAWKNHCCGRSLSILFSFGTENEEREKFSFNFLFLFVCFDFVWFMDCGKRMVMSEWNLGFHRLQLVSTDYED